MYKHYKLYLIASIIVAICMVAGASYYKFGHSQADTHDLAVYDAKQLAVYNGKNNAPCYVAIDKTVYSVKQGDLWKEGEHTTSNQQAYCGRNLTDVIGKSPHGRSKLATLTIVGTYK